MWSLLSYCSLFLSVFTEVRPRKVTTHSNSDVKDYASKAQSSKAGQKDIDLRESLRQIAVEYGRRLILCSFYIDRSTVQALGNKICHTSRIWDCSDLFAEVSVPFPNGLRHEAHWSLWPNNSKKSEKHKTQPMGEFLDILWGALYTSAWTTQ